MRKAKPVPEIRFTVVKDYYTDAGDNCTDTWCILYGTEHEANQALANLNAGQDLSWFNPADNAFLYITEIEL